MKTFILEAYNQPLTLVERERPLLEHDEILVKVRACGICQTDLKIIRGEIPPPSSLCPISSVMKWPERWRPLARRCQDSDRATWGSSIAMSPATPANDA